MEKGKRVLFLRFSSFGDIIFANYCAMRIKEKHPEFHLTWLTDSQYSAIVGAQPWVDEVMEWDRRNTGNRGYIEILKRVRGMGFDILVDRHSSDRSSLFSLFSGIRERYGAEKRFPFTHNHFSLEGLMDTSLPLSGCRKYLYAPKADLSGDLSTAPGVKRVGLAIGASYAVKRWPAKRWAEFCRLASCKDMTLFLMGSGRDEKEMAEDIIAASGASNIINMVGKLSLTESVSLVGAMDAVISGDTGLMHVSRALGVPVVGLFGSNYPCVGDDTENYLNSLGVFYVCRCPETGCKKTECSRQCLEDITADEVLDGLSALLEKR